MITTRNVTITDFDIINDFIEELENTHFDRRKQLEIFKKNIANTENIYLVAEENNKVVGYLSCHVQLLLHHGGRVGEIQEMFVSGEKRSHGIGKLLLKRLRTLAVEMDLVQLEVTSNKDRLMTHKFYEREDFKLTHKKFTLPLKHS
jgi:(aminoalkyl)phosphonate N-acetyltransferase